MATDDAVEVERHREWRHLYDFARGGALAEAVTTGHLSDEAEQDDLCTLEDAREAALDSLSLFMEDYRHFASHLRETGSPLLEFASEDDFRDLVEDFLDYAQDSDLLEGSLLDAVSALWSSLVLQVLDSPHDQAD